MNTKQLGFFALALCMCMIVAPVMAAGESKYVDRNQFDEQSLGEKYAGTITGNLRCGYSTLTPNIGIRNVLNVDGSPNVDGEFTYYPINPDGKYEIYPIAQGRYQLHVANGNGGQSEDTFVNVVPGKFSQPEREILGHAISNSNYEESCVNLEIISAQYGKITTTTEIDVAAHDEYRYWIEAVGHWTGPWYNRRWVIDVQAHWSEWSNTHPHNCEHQTRQVAATYKTVVSGQYIDVTSIVNNLKTCRGLNIIADYKNLHYNALFTDPVPGTFKDLHVSFKINGISHDVIVAEDIDLNI